MISNIKIAVVVMALMALSAPALWADDGIALASSHQAGDRHHFQEEHMMAQVLNLSVDQEKQLKDIKQKQRESKKSVFEQMKANRVAFESEIVKASPDMGKINDLQAQIKTIQSQMADNHLNFLLGIKKILTPEQFAGYMALEKEEDLRKQEGHEKFGHNHWGDKKDDGDRNHPSDD